MGNLSDLSTEALDIADEDLFQLDYYNSGVPQYESQKLKGSTLYDVFGKTIKTEVASADVLTMGEGFTPIDLSVAPGAGKIFIPEWIALFLTFGTTAYATNTDIAIRYNGVTPNIFYSTGILGATSSARVLMQKLDTVASGLQLRPNAKLEAFIPGGNPTLGDSDLTFYVHGKVLTT